MRRVHLLAFLVTLLLVQQTDPVPAQGQYGPTLARDGDHFTLNGVPTFLIFASYFDAVRASNATWSADLNFFQQNNVSGVRILPNWWHYECPNRPADDDSLIRRDGTLNANTLQRVKDFLAEASARNLVVDVTFTRETLGDSPLVDFATYRTGVQAATTALTAYRNVLFDVQNEWTKPEQQFSETEIRDLVAAVHERDPQRLASGSTENADPAAGAFAANVGIDFAAHHDERVGNWNDLTGSVIGGVRQGLGSAVKPIYLQEPTPYSSFCPGQSADSDQGHHHTAVRNARNAGGAAWTFHTRTSFSLSTTSFIAAASDAQEQTISGLRTASNQTCWGSDVLSLSPQSASVGASGGSGTFTVSTYGTCNETWGVSSDAAWLTAAPVSSSGNGTVMYTAAANGSGAQREGHLTVRGRTFTVSQPAQTVLGDFSNDGHPDLVWRNTVTGKNAFWWMNGRTLVASYPFAPDDVVPQSWKIRAVGDVTGDVHPDVIWQDDATGTIAYWSFIGNQRQATAYFTPSTVPSDGDPDPPFRWEIAGAADMDRNGQLDLVWRRRPTGELRISHMNGAVRLNEVTITDSSGTPAVAADPWDIEGVADMNSDGWPDLVWRNSGDGRLAAWYMTDNVRGATPYLVDEKGGQIIMTDLTWRIVDAVDLANNGVRDGKPDLVWQRDGATANNIAVWYMDGIRRIAGVYMEPPSMTNAEWRMVGVK